MIMPDFLPVDEAALDGSGYLVRDETGQLHAASFTNAGWSYGSGASVARPITHYCRSGRHG